MIRFFILIALGCIPVMLKAQDPFSEVRERYRTWLIEHDTTAADSVIIWNDKITPEGKWNDIDYTSQIPSNWTTLRHLARVRSISLTLQSTGISDANRLRYEKNCLLAVDHWIKMQYRNPNWWYNEIGGPQYWRDILILLADKLSSAQKEATLKLLRQYNVRPNFTGANLAWSADLMLHDGLISMDSVKVKSASDLIINEIKTSKWDGIQSDYGFHQHGARLQIHSYGSSFVKENIRLAWELNGSPWSFPARKKDTLINLLLDGWSWLARGINNSPATIDRAISRADNLKSADLRKHLPYLMSISTYRKREITAMLAFQEGGPNPNNGFRYFASSDAAAFQQPSFSFILKMISLRSEVAESINGENRKGTFLNNGDGYLLKTGGEYLNIMPVMNWKRLPGQTMTTAADKILRSGYAGGLSDNTDGLAAMDQLVQTNADTLRVHKLWAFHQGQIISLIAPVSSNTPDSVYTTLNQCRLEGPVTTGVDWARHAGFQYQSLNNSRLTVSVAKASGSWNDINKGGSTEIVSDSIVTLTLTHKQGIPSGYIITSADKIQKKNMKPGFTVISNAVAVQAIQFQNDCVMAAFRDSKASIKLTGGITVTASKPCLLMITARGIYLSDPLHKGGGITITIGKLNMDFDLPADGSSVFRNTGKKLFLNETF